MLSAADQNCAFNRFWMRQQKPISSIEKFRVPSTNQQSNEVETIRVAARSAELIADAHETQTTIQYQISDSK